MREFALRLSLGASRGRLVRQLLTESMFAREPRGVAGLLVARWGGRALLRIGSNGPNPVPLDLPVDSVTARVHDRPESCNGSALRSGGACAAAVSRGRRRGFARRHARGVERRGLGPLPLRQDARRGANGPVLILLVGALLFARTFQNLLAVDTGFEREHVVTARFDPRLAGFSEAQLPALFERLLANARSIAGVRSAALALSGPATGSASVSDITVEGHPRFEGNDNGIREDFASDDYFTTLGTTLVAGRFLRSVRHPQHTAGRRDQRDDGQTVLRDASPLGHRYGYGSPFDHEIIGVVRDVKVDGIRTAAPPMA